MLAASLAAGFAAAVRPVAAQSVIHTDSEGLGAGEVSIPAADRDIPAYRAMPRKPGTFPVILVVQEIFGVHEHIRDVCRRLAKQGYMAIAPELYVRQGSVADMADVKDIIAKVVSKVPDAQVMSDLDATVAYAKASGHGDTAKLGITGFCWGGRITWLYAAHSAQVKAGVAWYGKLVGDSTANTPRHPVDIAAELKAPVLGLYGGADQGIPRRNDRSHARGVQGRRQAMRDRRLPGYAARLQRRLPPELPPGSGEGRVGAHARLVPRPRRRLSGPQSFRHNRRLDIPTAHKGLPARPCN